MSDNYFAQLQMLSMSANDSIADARLKLDRIAEIFQSRPEQREWIEGFAWLRKDFPVDALIQAGAFAVNFYDTPSLLPEELQHDSLGFVKDSHLVFRGGSFIRSRTREVMLPGGADMTLSRIPSISIQPITAIVRRMPCSMEQRCCLHTTATIGLCLL